MRPILLLMCLMLSIAGAVTYFPARGAAVPFWGGKSSVPADTPIDQLQKGEFLWMADAVTSGPLVMVVSLTEQRGYVYRNGILVGATSVSTGRPGHATPTGVFTVLQKQKEHRSTIYAGAPMPYMQRLTWGGVALHAGGLPGYPESHGCIHLPSEFARLLYEISPAGMTVVISSDASHPERVAHPGYLAPVSAVAGTPIERVPLGPTEIERWHPEASPSGPISIVLSRASRRIVVYRNGIEIGRARLTIRGDEPFTTHALVLAEGASNPTYPYSPDPAKYRWLRIGVPGHLGEAGTDIDPASAARIFIPPEFVNRLNAVLEPGATVLVTDEAITRHSTGPKVEVMDADPPA